MLRLDMTIGIYRDLDLFFLHSGMVLSEVNYLT